MDLKKATKEQLEAELEKRKLKEGRPTPLPCENINWKRVYDMVIQCMDEWEKKVLSMMILAPI